MTPARSWLSFFLAGFVVIIAMLLVTLFTPAPYGDLTRIGRLSDADFGWRAPPPVVDKADVQGVPLSEADVVVVGDSFSMTHRWQSKLVQQGYKVSTIYWGQIGWLCEDFTPWIRKAGFRGQLVVVESVERLLGERLDKGTHCKAMQRDPLVKAKPFLEPLETVPGFALNWEAKLTTGVIAYFNMRDVRKSPGDTVYAKETRVRNVKDGCKYFSHRLCEKALFFIEDTDNPPLQASAVDQMKTFVASQPELSFIWMVIPDKTTVYIDHAHAAGFAKAFSASGLGPDLFGFAADQREHVRDFYFPNDTHLSMHGQLILGDRMLQAVKEVLPLPSGEKP